MNDVMLIKADKKGNIDRKGSVDLYRKGKAIVKSGTVLLLVEVRKNGSMFELWALQEGGSKRLYKQGLAASDAWDYCLDYFSIETSNIK